MTDHSSKRMHERVRQYWQSVKENRAYPTEDEIEPQSLKDEWDYCFLVDMRRRHTDKSYKYQYMGKELIAAYGAMLGLVFAGTMEWLPFELPRGAIVVAVLLAAGTALYTAFLFGQAKGRDLWQSQLFAPHLLVQALVAGAALFDVEWLRWLLPANGLLVAAEVYGRHATEDGRRAARLIQDDPRFTTGVLATGHLLPLALLWTSSGTGVLAGALALAGLWSWEHLYVQAPQRVALA